MRLRVALLLVATGSAAACSAPPAAAPSPTEPPAPPPEAVASVPPCDPDLDAGSFARLALEAMERDVRPGQRIPLRVGYYTSPDVPFEPVAACVRWSVVEADMATVDGAAGILTVLPGAKGRIHLRGAVAASGTTVEAEIIVVGDAVAPIAGHWKEQARLDCGTRAWVPPERPIVHLELRAEGELVMTWTWQDFVSDYVAKYSYNPETARMRVEVTGGKYPPADPRMDGTARIERGALVLEGIWLASTRYAGEPRACGHRFVR
jgi:hypothetical protein